MQTFLKKMLKVSSYGLFGVLTVVVYLAAGVKGGSDFKLFGKVPSGTPYVHADVATNPDGTPVDTYYTSDGDGCDGGGSEGGDS